jgi:hypothetical protein
VIGVSVWVSKRPNGIILLRLIFQPRSLYSPLSQRGVGGISGNAGRIEYCPARSQTHPARELLYLKGMIGKINTTVILERALSHSTSHQKWEGFDFHSLPQGKIENSIPLEKIALEYLKKVLEIALMETKNEETYLSLSPLFCYL